MSDGKEVANQSAMQVQNLKQNLNEWKYVITAADAVLNTADPMKSAAAHAGLYTSVYVLFLITNVSSISPTQKPIFTSNAISPHPTLPPPKFTPTPNSPRFSAKHSYNGFRSPCICYHSRYFHWKTQ